MILLNITLQSSSIALAVQIGGVNITNQDPTVGTAVAHEALPAHSLAYIRSDGKLALASAQAEGREALCFVQEAYAAGETATYHQAGRVTGLSGLVPGDPYFMTTTPGVIGPAPEGSVGSGLVVLRVGTAVSATSVAFSPSLPITL